MGTKNMYAGASGRHAERGSGIQTAEIFAVRCPRIASGNVGGRQVYHIYVVGEVVRANMETVAS